MWATDKRVLAKWPQLRFRAHIVPADEENLEPLLDYEGCRKIDEPRGGRLRERRKRIRV